MDPVQTRISMNIHQQAGMVIEKLAIFSYIYANDVAANGITWIVSQSEFRITFTDENESFDPSGMTYKYPCTTQNQL